MCGGLPPQLFRKGVLVWDLESGSRVVGLLVVENQYTRKNSPKYPNFIQVYPKLMEALYNVYLKFKESDIPNTRI